MSSSHEATGGRRELTKAQNRQTILAAARQVFAEMGYGAATVRDIIRATPLASGTFYNYFKSKEEVYQAIRDEVALAIRRNTDTLRVRVHTQEVIAGFEELREDLETAIAKGLFPPVDADYLMAAIVGVAFEVAERMLRRDNPDPATAADFATALFMGGVRALPHMAVVAPANDVAVA